MTDPEELRARATSIFQQLRTEERSPTPNAAVPDNAEPDDATPDDAKPDGAKPDDAVPDGAKPDVTADEHGRDQESEVGRGADAERSTPDQPPATTHQAGQPTSDPDESGGPTADASTAIVDGASGANAKDESVDAATSAGRPAANADSDDAEDGRILHIEEASVLDELIRQVDPHLPDQAGIVLDGQQSPAAATIADPTTEGPEDPLPTTAPPHDDPLVSGDEPAVKDGDPALPVLPPAASRPGHPAAGRPLPRLIAIANQKGGVGKTTTAVNLGASLAELGYRVLVVDLDPQGNATTGLGINARSLESSVYDVILHDVAAEDVIEPTTLRNLFVLPATIDLAGAEIELVPMFSRELRLKRALETVQGDYDFILVDCPPSLGLLTINGLAAATEVAVPIQCEYYALEGLGQLLRNVTMVQANLNASLELSTIILTMYDARTRLAEQVVNEVREHFGDRVCRNVVPRTVRLSEAPSFGQPIIVFDSSSRGSIAYRELAKEVSGGASQRVG